MTEHTVKSEVFNTAVCRSAWVPEDWPVGAKVTVTWTHPDSEDEFCRILHRARELICVWQTENHRRDLVELGNDVVRAIDEAGSHLASWSKYDRTHENENQRREP